MKERPILFSGSMVRALLAGTKTQTRRVVKPTSGPHTVEQVIATPDSLAAFVRSRCPYGQPGDRLWVRETWAKWGRDDQCGEGPSQTHEPIYRADGYPWDDRGKWIPSIHMPRWASRITLEVTGVRVERLQDISEADAIAEGIERGKGFPGWYRGPLPGDSAGLEQAGREFKIPTAFPHLAYRALWESINGPGSWDANPWVWVVEYRRMTPTNSADPHTGRCRRCGGEMRPGIAMQSTVRGSADFPGAEVVTMSPGGPGRLVECIKCGACGWSVTPGQGQ